MIRIVYCEPLTTRAAQIVVTDGMHTQTVRCVDGEFYAFGRWYALRVENGKTSINCQE